MPTQKSERPIPSAALRFMKDWLDEVRVPAPTGRYKANRARCLAICPGKLEWLTKNLKGRHDELLWDFKTCYRSRLGKHEGCADLEARTVARLSEALEKEVKDEWALSAVDWNSFVHPISTKVANAFTPLISCVKFHRSEKS